MTETPARYGTVSSIRLPPDADALLDQLAAQDGVSRSRCLTTLIRAAARRRGLPVPAAPPPPAATRKPVVYIGPALRTLRTARGWTLAHLAAAAGTSPAYVQSLEHNRRSVGPALLRALAGALAVPEAALTAPGGEADPAVETGPAR